MNAAISHVLDLVGRDGHVSFDRRPGSVDGQTWWVAHCFWRGATFESTGPTQAAAAVSLRLQLGGHLVKEALQERQGVEVIPHYDEWESTAVLRVNESSLIVGVAELGDIQGVRQSLVMMHPGANVIVLPIDSRLADKEGTAARIAAASSTPDVP